jgi:hypothetical protein
MLAPRIAPIAPAQEIHEPGTGAVLALDEKLDAWILSGTAWMAKFGGDCSKT